MPDEITVEVCLAPEDVGLFAGIVLLLLLILFVDTYRIERKITQRPKPKDKDDDAGA